MSIDLVKTQLRAFILTLITCEVVGGQDNNVGPPVDPYILMTPGRQTRLGTNETSYNGASNKTLTRFTQYDIQLDFYGPQSGEWARIIETAFRDDYACDLMAPDVVPLHCSDAMQVPLINGEENYEERWMITASLESNPDLVLPQESANTLAVTLVNVEATYP